MHEHLTCDVLVTPEEALQRFRDNGVSVAAWAVRNGFNPAIVYAVLRGGRKCLRGQSHEIAVSLGIKQGRRPSVVTTPNNFARGTNPPGKGFQTGDGSGNARASENEEGTTVEGEVATS